MSVLPPSLMTLAEALAQLPGVGPKTAQRLAFFIVDRGRDAGAHIASAITAALERIGHCEQCNNYSDEPVCALCRDSLRDDGVICVVESPLDVVAIEQSGAYRGRYFVLGGHLSPLDGIGPEDIGIERLEARMDALRPEEVILATNPTVEGEATAHYIAECAAARNIPVTRIAQGVPMGGELGYTDPGTLGYALRDRKRYTDS